MLRDIKHIFMQVENLPERLVIEIKNIQSLELVEMANCLLSAGAEYQRYLSVNESAAAAEDVKLFVREVRSGSAIFDICAASGSILPQMIEHGRTLLGFVIDLKKVLGYLKKESPDKPEGLDKAKLDRVIRIVQPTAKDSPGAQFSIYYVENGKIADTINLNVMEANAIQNTARTEIEKLSVPVAGFHENSVLYFFQTRDDTQSETGDKSIIERLSKNPVKTKFATAESKAKILGIEGNIYHNAFIVDVRVETIDDKPILYTVLRVHEVIPKPKQDNLPLLE